jgi:hypothetical protein
LPCRFSFLVGAGIDEPGPGRGSPGRENQPATYRSCRRPWSARRPGKRSFGGHVKSRPGRRLGGLGCAARVLALLAEATAHVSEVGEHGVAKPSGGLPDGRVVDEAEEDEVALLDGVEGTHPVGCKAKCEEGCEFQVHVGEVVGLPGAPAHPGGSRSRASIARAGWPTLDVGGERRCQQPHRGEGSGIVFRHMGCGRPPAAAKPGPTTSNGRKPSRARP